MLQIEPEVHEVSYNPDIYKLRRLSSSHGHPLGTDSTVPDQRAGGYSQRAGKPKPDDDGVPPTGPHGAVERWDSPKGNIG
jgi:hypothetical protein